MGLMSIGEFAHLSRLSPKALRLYDELGLLVPARVDAATGYRRYADAQLDQARLVSSLRRLGVPLARIKEVLSLEPASAAEAIRAHWAWSEAEHAAQRVLVARLVDRLHGEKPAMYEVTVRDIPERSLLSRISRVHQDELEEVTRELFIRRLRGGGAPRTEGVAGAPFIVYHGEVSGDSDGPVEWCWPVPAERAEEVATGFPDLTLRTEPAHQEAFVRQDAPGRWVSSAQAEVAVESLYAWAADRHRRPSGGLRGVLVPDPAGTGAGPYCEFAIALR
ncbi:helix-turn-helix domain-containing protein [Kitasatospora sp. NBC_01250]|uniref:MerR family transcriptional regulator n=1 Tax=unclassified Kitasatospora TaxID=2633591 RepID=UPI002E1664E2|nr:MULTISPECIES: helix-turn-helix domain-containing protein [unclassified Kitasatospora]WSJ69212.1 helix-turn-helix domain-containing protein [Kitasatospora sp. NBC_01302]